MKRRLALGLDFGTESARAVLVEAANGRLVGRGEHSYAHGVVDSALPDGGPDLPPEFALQWPADVLESLERAVRAALEQAHADAGEVIGIGIDSTACTMLPVDGRGAPLCEDPRFRREPHAWAKLWKHHGANDQALRIDRLARERDEHWRHRYGGTVSSEWLLPKAWETLENAPQVYEAADRFVEVADWIVHWLTGVRVRGACAAGYKGLCWEEQPSAEVQAFASALDPRLAQLFTEKVCDPVVPAGTRVGGLRAELAERLSLRPGVPVSAPIIDAHAAVPGAGVLREGQMVLILGTSSCHMLLGRSEVLVPGIQGVVRNGILPGFYGYEAGQAASGDMLDWWVERILARRDEASAHAELTAAANALAPGESGMLALDWWNGNRSILVNPLLSGAIVGLTKSSSPAEIYRTLLESTAFGTRCILEQFAHHGVRVDEIRACGGMAEKNDCLLQIFADVTGRPIARVAHGDVCARGAALFGALAAGARGGGFDVVADAVVAMAPRSTVVFQPRPREARIYDELFPLWMQLHDTFGRTSKEWMAELRNLRTRVRGAGASG